MSAFLTPAPKHQLASTGREASDESLHAWVYEPHGSGQFLIHFNCNRENS
jgi:hypothetical protein